MVEQKNKKENLMKLEIMRLKKEQQKTRLERLERLLQRFNDTITLLQEEQRLTNNHIEIIRYIQQLLIETIKCVAESMR